MPRFLTRHSHGFQLTEGQLDPGLSPHARNPDYAEKVSALARVVNAGQFLWPVEKASGFPFYEMSKPVEWEVIVPQERVLGYIDENEWLEFVKGKALTLPPCFSRDVPSCTPFSVLLSFPLNQHELVLKRVYNVKSPHCTPSSVWRFWIGR